MKKIILLITAFFVLSCSQDNPDSQDNSGNNNNNNGPIPRYAIKLPETINLSSVQSPNLNREYKFTYDNRNRLTKTTVTGALNAVFEYTYTEFQLTSVSVNTTTTFTILYDSSGRLSGVLNNGVTTPITFDSVTELYTYGTHVFSIKEKDIRQFNSDTYYLLLSPYWGFFYSVLGYNSFAALLTDEKMLNFATRRPCENLFHPVTHQSKSMAFTIYGSEYFHGGVATFDGNINISLSCTYIDALQYEDIPRL
jgi:hypothetical protein